MGLLAVGLAVIEGAAASPARAAPVAPFTAVFHTQDNGAIGLFGNTVETCPLSVSTCLAARNGTATNGDLNTLDNNDYNMTYINIDPAPGIINSSSADVTLPAGSTVLFAGLYWGGRQFAGTGAQTPRCL